MENLIFVAALPVFIASLVVFLIHPRLVKIAKKKQIVDNPNARKLNKVPVPVLGGVGVFSDSCSVSAWRDITFRTWRYSSSS